MSTSKLGLKERILKYFKGRPELWIASGEIQRLVVAHTQDTPRSAVRRMQELAEEGKLRRELRRGHSFYRFNMVHAPHRGKECELCLAASAALKAFNNT